MLKNLPELFSTSKENVKRILDSVPTVKLSKEFKRIYLEKVNSKTLFIDDVAFITTSTQKYVAPAVWFLVAANLTELLEEVYRYKKYVKEALLASSIIDNEKDADNWLNNLKKTKNEPESSFIETCINDYGDDDANSIMIFLNNYDSWGGGKSIGRGDYYQSPIMNASGLLNETSGAVSWFTDELVRFPELRNEILNNYHITKTIHDGEEPNFEIENLYKDLNNSGLIFQDKVITRFVSSLITKPFVLLSGLSGSGKTKLAQAFAQWICQNDSQFCLVPVGADWTNREPLLGYPNALKPDEYIKPDNKTLDLIINANENPSLPYFLILDEMNLSHVERYFADFLSVIESKDEISLYTEGAIENGVPAKLSLPANLFIIGTVNIDETTYMFSPKVLDRANAIEFRVNKDEMENFFKHQKDIDMDLLKSKGASMAKGFLDLAENKQFEDADLSDTHETLLNFFEQLKKAGAEFGYRSASEIIRLINQLNVIDETLKLNEKLDIAIMQKLLPKLHGSRRKLHPVLLTLAGFCINAEKIKSIEKDIFMKDDFDFESEAVKYPISLEKITRMYQGAIENGFASYAEA